MYGWSIENAITNVYIWLLSGRVCTCTVLQGFTRDEGKELLAKWTSRSVSELPQEAKKIIDMTCGWPIALNIIGEDSKVWMEGERDSVCVCVCVCVCVYKQVSEQP